MLDSGWYRSRIGDEHEIPKIENKKSKDYVITKLALIRMRKTQKSVLTLTNILRRKKEKKRIKIKNKVKKKNEDKLQNIKFIENINTM
jgi:hypothetical protein